MDKILVLDFGGQYNLLIARRVRNLNVYAEVKSYDAVTVEDIKKEGYGGIILTGGPNSVNDPASPTFSPGLLDAGIPILGICYGHQLLAKLAGGAVSAGAVGEYGSCGVEITAPIDLFDGIPATFNSFMSHHDCVTALPEGFRGAARTANIEYAAMFDPERRICGVQFHPEVTHTEFGTEILRNFLFKICGLTADWRMDDFMEKTITELREKLDGRNVLLGLSGGVDSSVLAALLYKAVGDRLRCVFVDHGLLRKDEGDLVEKAFMNTFGMSIIRVDAAKIFLDRLKGVTEPEKKRKIIGEEFIRIFEAEAMKAGEIDYLAQGTIYPDVVESGGGKASVIKSHHNVGGLPVNIKFKGIVEPLRTLFKDEVRELGRRLGLPDQYVKRQPFPGPGLAVRIIGEITGAKLKVLKEADAIMREELIASLPDPALPDQYFAVLTDTRSVGVMGDERTYGYTIALRAVDTDDFMTCSFTRIPYEVLERVSGRITNEIKGVTRVVYDVTSKPPATVEWE
ncbi:MAG: glutamine-hydrolyzing GMP synthase [Clostridia bacterium]|nr:glutamine-hydrolyzing GMP synthase [Clostridia bacterium]